jgi:hypothetical protein
MHRIHDNGMCCHMLGHLLHVVPLGILELFPALVLLYMFDQPAQSGWELSSWNCSR